MLAWLLCKDDMHKSRSVKKYYSCLAAVAPRLPEPSAPSVEVSVAVCLSVGVLFAFLCRLPLFSLSLSLSPVLNTYQDENEDD